MVMDDNKAQQLVGRAAENVEQVGTEIDPNELLAALSTVLVRGAMLDGFRVDRLRIVDESDVS